MPLLRIERVIENNDKQGAAMNTPQPGILDEIPRIARYLSFSIRPDSNPAQVIRQLSGHIDGTSCVV